MRLTQQILLGNGFTTYELDGEDKEHKLNGVKTFWTERENELHWYDGDGVDVWISPNPLVDEEGIFFDVSIIGYNVVIEGWHCYTLEELNSMLILVRSNKILHRIID